MSDTFTLYRQLAVERPLKARRYKASIEETLERTTIHDLERARLIEALEGIAAGFAESPVCVRCGRPIESAEALATGLGSECRTKAAVAMTATANQMSAPAVADPPEGADGPAPVAPPAAPFARVVEAPYATSPGSSCRRWFVHSATTPGAWWRVDFIPGESLTCSCPAGLRVGVNVGGRPCRHVRAVCERMAAAAEAVRR